jgi:hypothetical protein
VKHHFALDRLTDDEIIFYSHRAEKLYGQTLGEFFMTIDRILALDMGLLSGEGEEFVWKERDGYFHGDHFAKCNVPDPDAFVHLHRAIDFYIDDISRGREFLKRDRSAEALWSVMINTHRWMQFWAKRWPEPDQRARYIQAAIYCEGALARIADQAAKLSPPAKPSAAFFSDEASLPRPSCEGMLLGSWPKAATAERNKRIAAEREANIRELPKPNPNDRRH